MKLYSNVYDYAIYTLNCYEDKYFISFFVHSKTWNNCADILIIIKKKFNDKSFEMHFLREQFLGALMF